MRLFVVLIVITILNLVFNEARAANRKRFIFRIDDIEDYYNSNTQISLLNFFMSNNIAVSAGIIGNYFTGADVPLYNTLQQCAALGPDKCAIFNHGADAVFTFASATSVQDAKARVASCDSKIKSLFPGYQPEVFVPHQNSWSPYLLSALTELGYKAISASTLPYSNLPWDLTKTPLQLSQQTTTADYSSSGTWIPVPAATNVADCEAAAARGEDCVIMVHPHEFASGTYTLAMLQTLVNTLTAQGWTSINFHTVISEIFGGVINSPVVFPVSAPVTSPVASPVATPSQSAPNSSIKRFIFRIDDIEDYYNSNTQISLLNFFMSNNIAVSAGIIGNYFTGADVPLYNTLQQCAALGPDKCAIFNHGADAVFTFASATSVQDAKARVASCDSKIKSLFPGYQPEVFVPHQNSWSPYLLSALTELGYKAISASTLPYSNLPWDLTKTPLQLSQQTTTADYSSSGTWIPVPAATNVADCEAAAARGEDCVIMVHPHEFASGTYTLAMLQTLVNTLTAQGWTSINFHTVISEIFGGVINSPVVFPVSAPVTSPVASPVATPSQSAPNSSIKRFIFRIDDIEDYYNSNTQISLLNFFMSNNIAVSAGIIGNYFTGADVPLYNTLQQCAALGPDKCAIFNHGADAVFTFASATSVQDAKARVASCDSKIKSLFPGYQPEVFVPHQNSWSPYLLSALTELGYKAISASTLPYSNLPWDLTKTPLQLSQQTTTADYSSSGTWIPVPAATNVADCEAAAARGEDCVIMVHPHEFASGTYTLAMLQTLVNTLTAQGWTSINFHTVITEKLGTSINVPITSPVLAPVSSPTIIPTAIPTVSFDTQAVWGQCGGQDWTGPTTCEVGSVCQVHSIWYSQCVPSSEPISATNNPTAKPSATPTVVPSASFNPSYNPTPAPTISATLPPTIKSTVLPTVNPTFNPSAKPTAKPTAKPSAKPTAVYSVNPTARPSVSTATTKPSTKPTAKPSSRKPTAKPTR